MGRKLTSGMIGLAVLAALAGPGWAQQPSSGEPQRVTQVVKGPSTNSYGRLLLVLPEGAESEIDYQPDAETLGVKTIVGEARVITSARYLILVESVAGRVEIRLATGRVITVEPGQAEIVGQAIVDDPGQTVVRLNGTGPMVAQAGGPPVAPGSSARTTVLTGTPAAALAGQPVVPGPTGPTPSSLSPFTPTP